MKNTNDGGQAFPTPFGTEVPGIGMTLRQYYAAAALTGIIQLDPTDAKQFSNPNGRDYYSWMSDEAFKHADAMLAHESNEGSG